MTGYLGPNLLNFSFSSGASFARNVGGWVLPLCIYPQPTDISHKEVDKRDGQRIKHSFYDIVERIFGMLYSRQTHLLALRSHLLHLRHLLLVHQCH